TALSTHKTLKSRSPVWAVRNRTVRPTHGRRHDPNKDISHNQTTTYAGVGRERRVPRPAVRRPSPVADRPPPIAHPVQPAKPNMIAKDLGFAVRTLRKQPAFTITAILSVVNALLLRPLPYVQPDRLATIQADLRTRRVFNFPWPGGDLLDVKQQLTAFESIAGISSGPTAFVGDDGKAEQIVAAGVTPNFFTLLGTKIAFGRNFVESDGAPNPRR